MASREYIAKIRRRRTLRDNIIRLIVRGFVWTGAIVLYYFAFSLFFDTPIEYRIKHSTDRLRREYELLTQRYDSLGRVLDNVIERDRNVFRILFEAEPYDFDSEYASDRWNSYEKLLSESTRKLQQEFAQRLERLETDAGEMQRSYADLQDAVARCETRDRIPAIQPVNNQSLTLLTASYGMRINPFRKILQSHQGVDYAIPEGTRVFATADGRIKEASPRNSTSGTTLVIDHGNGYETSYSHLGKLLVTKGQIVHRGDIVALSGNSGLSLAPHLHYEVRQNGMRVDPIHYFFMELSPEKYRRMMQIAQSGMQSFD